MMTRVLFSSAVLVTSLAVATPIHAVAPQAKPAAKPAAGAARTVTLEGTDAMKFVPATIAAKPGETLRIVLKGVGNMPKIAMAHNFILLTLKADAQAFANDALKARATNYIPAARKAEVIASTGLIGKGETTEVTFTVPKQPGTYTFICSFPGHFAAGMKGTLTVK